MYRDARDVLRDRQRAAVERARRQRESLSEQERARLPAELAAELARVEARLEPEEAAASVVVGAEEALDEHERLLKRARAALGEVDRAERRARRDRALAKIRPRAPRKVPWLVVLIIGVTAASLYALAREHTEDECRFSPGCQIRGQCGSNWRLSCVAKTDRNCRASEDCRHLGWCSVMDGRCVAKLDADCEHSVACTAVGRCTASKGDCVREP